MDEQLQEVCRELIYHGRYFSPRRDSIAIEKCVNYIKEVARMAGERQSYRSAAPVPEEEPMTDEEYEQEAQAPPRRSAPLARPAPRTAAPPRGGYDNKTARGNQDGEFITITGLFPTKSGKADTAFVKPDILAHLRDIQEGDAIGVSMNKKTNRLQLWYIRKG